MWIKEYIYRYGTHQHLVLIVLRQTGILLKGIKILCFHKVLHPPFEDLALLIWTKHFISSKWIAELSILTLPAEESIPYCAISWNYKADNFLYILNNTNSLASSLQNLNDWKLIHGYNFRYFLTLTSRTVFN